MKHFIFVVAIIVLATLAVHFYKGITDIKSPPNMAQFWHRSVEA